jgi:hypothetical protein
VEPDVRVVSRQTLSLGEDRTLLAATLEVSVGRAGIFKLSFALPAGLDVESISGESLSHWTELKSDSERIITVHLKGKTEGQTQFELSLSGPGIRPTESWAAPRLLLREASKQQGQLVIVPEQGMRLKAVSRDGATQLDPARSGIRQKGVLAFRLLHADWQLALEIDQVDSWIQVASLQQVTVREGQSKVIANLDYQIENTGVKALRVSLPADAENVRFTGEQISDFLQVESAGDAEGQLWEVKLRRRVIGEYALQAAYTVRIPEQAPSTDLVGVTAREVNLQRGFLALQAEGRLQVVVASIPPALRQTEWEAVPSSLRRGESAPNASYVFRLVEPEFLLPVNLDRHEAAKLLPAQVRKVDLASVVSHGGIMVTRALLEIQPGDKRVLRVTVPPEAEFWFAFVNQSGVWLWRENDQVLIPLEQPSAADAQTTVEFYYSVAAGRAATRSLDLRLLGPKFDLPLQEIAWRVYLDEKWELEDWGGSLQLQEEAAAVQAKQIDIDAYLLNEKAQRQQQTEEATELLNLANTFLLEGDQTRARQAFKGAYNLSQHDAAFNEDARVQFQNIKMQQALIGLNYQREAARGEAEGVTAELRDLRPGQAPAYTQDEAKRILGQNTPEENAAFLRLAERLVEQQDAAGAKPTAIRATLPERGRLLTFTRSLQVDTWSDLVIELEAAAAKVSAPGTKLLVLALIFVAAYLFSLGLRKSETE